MTKLIFFASTLIVIVLFLVLGHDTTSVSKTKQSTNKLIEMLQVPKSIGGEPIASYGNTLSSKELEAIIEDLKNNQPWMPFLKKSNDNTTLEVCGRIKSILGQLKSQDANQVANDLKEIQSQLQCSKS